MPRQAIALTGAIIKGRNCVAECKPPRLEIQADCSGRVDWRRSSGREETTEPRITVGLISGNGHFAGKIARIIFGYWPLPNGVVPFENGTIPKAIPVLWSAF